MKQRFVLDENVFQAAYTGKNDRGEDDLMAGTLILNIAQLCHCIVVDPELCKRYSKKANTLKGFVKAVNVMSIMRMMLANPNKGRFARAPATIPNEETIPEDDRPLVRLAAAESAILVTTDEPLRDALATLASGRARGRACRVLTPEAALDVVMRTDP